MSARNDYVFTVSERMPIETELYFAMNFLIRDKEREKFSTLLKLNIII